MLEVSFWRRFQLKVRGYAYLRHEKRRGWKASLPIYLVRCKKHGLYTDYPHGYSQYFLCPKCLDEEVTRHEE